VFGSSQPSLEIMLIELAEKYKRTADQKKLINWFDASTGEKKQREFAAIWRNDKSNAPIDFLDVFKFYKGLPQQKKALLWLEQNSQPKTLAFFEKMYPTDGGGLIELKIEWDSQTNSRNREQANRMCFSSSVWMAMNYLHPLFTKRFRCDDDYLDAVLKVGDTTEAFAHLTVLSNLGYQVNYTQTANLGDIDDHLSKGRPVGIGILHHGSLENPYGGHWVVVGGCDGNRYKLFDPYGCLLDQPEYSGAVERGNGYWVGGHILDARWTVSSESDGWAMLF
jgi:hypothetical protein